jgi:hypothetical protein
MPAYFGRFEGPDHLYPTCPALARTKPWRQPWPDTTIDEVDPWDPTDLCGWCVRVWRSRTSSEVGDGAA